MQPLDTTQPIMILPFSSQQRSTLSRPSSNISPFNLLNLRGRQQQQHAIVFYWSILKYCFCDSFSSTINVCLLQSEIKLNEKLLVYISTVMYYMKRPLEVSVQTLLKQDLIYWTHSLDIRGWKCTGENTEVWSRKSHSTEVQKSITPAALIFLGSVGAAWFQLAGTHTGCLTNQQWHGHFDEDKWTSGSLCGVVWMSQLCTDAGIKGN